MSKSKKSNTKHLTSGLWRALLLGGATIGASAQATAQQAATAPAATNSSDEIVVTARRPLAESEAASLAIQREADSVVSVLSADAIGRLPDQNIAFAIGRLPGVSIERDQGQARYVNLRGTPVYWNTLSFDGLSVVSPEGRATRLDNVPSVLASQVLVTKAITADMPGDTVSGNINIITRRASEYDGFTLFGNAALGYVTLGGGEEVDTSLVYADQFLNDRLGVLLQGSYYRRNMVTDNWETDPYIEAPAGQPGVRFAREYENKPYRLTRENSSLSFRVDYEINPNHSVFASSIWTQYADEELRNNYIFRFDQGRTATGASTGINGAGAITGNTPTFGTVFAVQLRNNTNSLESEEDTYINSLGGESLVGPWTLDWRANYTFSSDGRDAPALPDFRSPSGSADRPTVQYDFQDGHNNTVRLFRTNVVGSTLSRGEAVASIDSFQWPLRLLSRRSGGDITQAWTFKLDAEREFDAFGSNIEFSTGLLYVDRAKKSREVLWTTGDLTSSANAATLARFNAAGYNVNTFYDQIRLGRPYLGEYGLGYNFTYHSKSRLDQITADLIARGVMTRDTATELNNYYDVSERVLAAYAMAVIDQPWGNVVVGLRGEQIQNESTALPLVGGVRRLTTIESEETLFYPSLHINWDITDEWKARLGFTSTASRPDFDDLRPNFTIDDVNRTISGGNPDARPERQIGVDAYLEWYMEPEGYFSAGVFYKDLSDVLFLERTAFGSSALDSGSTIRSDYAFTRVNNAGDGWVQGLELAYSQTAAGLVESMDLPEWLGGFGIRATAVWVDSEVNIPAVRTSTGTILNPERTAPLLGTSDSTYNLQLTYEMYGLSVRLAYQQRSPWGQSYGSYVTNGGQIVPGGNNLGPRVDSANGDIYWDSDDELDLSIRYQVNDNFEWYFDGVNLLNGAGRRYADSPNYPIEYETFGPRFIMGTRFNF